MITNQKTFFNLDKSGGCYILAEAGLNHNGSLEIAKKLIDIAYISGVDAVKFQKRTVEKLAIGSVLNAVDGRFPEFGTTYREIREHLEFDFDQYKELKEYSEQKELDFIVTAFDTEAVDFLEDLGVEGYKLASHSLTNIDLLKYIAKTGKPTILSTGMANMSEIGTAVNIYQQSKTPLMLLHCVSAYPTPFDECNLSVMNLLKESFNLPVGYSGHELGFLPTTTAVAMGAVAVERHYTIDKNLPGFDHKISLEPDELINMVRDIRNIEKIRGSGIKEVSETEWITRDKYHVSMVSINAIPTGTVLEKTMVTYRNPGTGIPAKEAEKIIGKKAKYDIQADVILKIDMFE